MNGARGTSRIPDVPPGYLYAYAGTLRDALISAINLDIFQRHADKVAMANPAQLVNTIHSLFHTYEDKFILTPNYHVFEMYGAHAGATSCTNGIRSAEGELYPTRRSAKGNSGESLGIEWFGFRERQTIDADGG